MNYSSKIAQKDFSDFLNTFKESKTAPLLYFHPFQCPVCTCEIQLSVRTIQDYSVFSLFILRMFDAGITNPELIAAVSGMSIDTVKTYIEKEYYLLQHIDPNTQQLTDLGRETLENNRAGEDEAKSCEYYHVVSNIQVDALTGTVIPAYLEKDNMDVKPDSSQGTFILPKEGTECDENFNEALRQRLLPEINTRLKEYIDSDYLKNGDIIELVDDIRTVRLFYRNMYLVKFEGMFSPMIVLSGKKSITDINAKSNVEGKGNRFVITPLAISSSDKEYLDSQGIFFENVLVRNDSCFEHLKEKADNMELTLPDMPEMNKEETIEAQATENEDSDSDNISDNV